ncbi:MAG TPA: dihydroorotase [Parvibaculum sp.]|uniref:dihydroorotase n=1 Tax=Parvibaculum sp. TaxID=2024848 RepID=UPI002C498594|nr:dihydroorotase [Parvibaculum sp.]HMM13193.1 dihydroorotase [Parvibaculum sp.]
MNASFDLILRGGTLVNHDGVGKADIAIRDGRIAAIGDLATASAGEIVDVTGLHVLPGVVDSQVHLREPGNEHKEDLETGGRAAVLGGVTTVFEMPNTKPPTTTPELLADKVARARHRMYCDFAFYGGATTENVDLLPELERSPGCCGIKIFMGSSTGTLLVASDEDVRRVLKAINRRAAVHSEDEFRLRDRRPLAETGKIETHPVWRDAEAAVLCTTRLLKLAREAGKRIHVLHVSTADEMPLLAAAKDIASVEVTPQHLTLAAPECYEELGSYAVMNPPIRDARHREGLWQGLAAGIVDVLGSDHAPHTREEKAETYPKCPSGMPGVQTLVPIMLDHVNAGRLSIERFVDLTSQGPQRVFGMARKGRVAVGYDADLTIVDLKARRTITNDWIASRCGWTPFDGKTVTGWPIGTVIRGRRVMWDDEIIGAAAGEPVTFLEALPRG